jgi:hypothetical protein
MLFNGNTHLQFLQSFHVDGPSMFFQQIWGLGKILGNHDRQISKPH